MKKTLFILFVFAVFINTNAQEIKWLTFEEAVEANKTNPKLMLIDVYTDWCGWCKKMDKTTYSNAIIIAYVNKNFHPVKLDGEQKEDIIHEGYTFKFKQQGRSKYNEFTATLLNGKLSYPTTVFMDENVQVLNRTPGYLDTETMEKVLTFFASKEYLTKKWEEFEKGFKSNL
jgi:thioredoxin-related protein